MASSIPIDVTIRAMRVAPVTVKCFSPSARSALRLALDGALKDAILPRGARIVSVEFSGLRPGDPITGEEIVAVVKRFGFEWRGR